MVPFFLLWNNTQYILCFQIFGNPFYFLLNPWDDFPWIIYQSICCMETENSMKGLKVEDSQQNECDRQ